jgi:vitamin B12/bleomycin/antimicrobial peptide transport system ATP-binding/permease protein
MSAPTSTPHPAHTRPLSKWAAFRQFTARAWALAAPYFASEEKWKARGLLAAVVALNLGWVYLLVLFNDWYRLFYDALQNKDQAVFWEQLGRFTYIAFGLIFLAVYKFYLTQLLEMRWRKWMTAHYLQRWLTKQAFYKMELARFGDSPDNPDQRIQDDINRFTTQTVSLSMGLLNAVVTLGSFVGILWGLSGPFGFSLAGTSYSIPGFMVWMAVLYCAVGSVITHYIGRPLISLNFQQQQVEANFRHRMVRVREYSESIALDKGETVEGQQLDVRFSAVLSNYLRLIRAQKKLIWFNSFFGQAAVVFPFIVAAPRFFSGAIQLGELMQISSAFGRVQDSLSWFADNYATLAEWRATTDRLTSFEASIASLSQENKELIASNSVAVNSKDLSVSLPNGDVLLTGAVLQIHGGERLLLSGPSGSGKSTLFRALASIWPFAKGHVQRPESAMFIPQRPYFPDGTLRDALTYPEAAQHYTDADLQQALRYALLEPLADQLDTVGAWSQKLSGGEQQRLAIARVLLKKPQWVFADEATSALDEAAQTTLYQRLADMVAQQGGSLVSIAHRPGVAAFHNRVWQLVPQAAGSPARFALCEKTL